MCQVLQQRFHGLHKGAFTGDWLCLIHLDKGRQEYLEDLCYGDLWLILYLWQRHDEQLHEHLEDDLPDR